MRDNPCAFHVSNFPRNFNQITVRFVDSGELKRLAVTPLCVFFEPHLSSPLPSRWLFFVLRPLEIAHTHITHPIQLQTQRW